MEFHKLTERIPTKNTPIWLLLQIDNDTIIFKGQYFGFEEETHLFQIQSGGFCTPLAWTEIDNIPQIPVL